MRVRFHATLRDAVGGRDADLGIRAPCTARELVAHVVRCRPAARELLLDEEGALRREVHVFVGGRDARYLDDGLDAVLREGDEVDVFPAVGGG